MNKLNDYIKWGLMFSDNLHNPMTPSYNPLAEFVPYVATKEIVHSRIISELLSPSGNHGENERFLKEFFSLLKLDYSKFHDFNVIRERKVGRVLTEGGSRSIDILITYKDDESRSHAIIIENKLNHAEYQYLQLEDYEKGIELECFNVDRIVLLHDIEQSIMGNSYVGEKYVYLYPADLYKWISSSTSNSNILSYADYLNSLNNQNISKLNAKIMKNLSLAEIKSLKKVVDAYSNLGSVLMDDVVTSVQSELTFSITSEPNIVDIGWKGVCVKNAEDYKRNGVWVELFYPKDPADDDLGYDVYLYSYEDNVSKATEIAERCDFEFAGIQDGYSFFRAKNGKFRFHMFPHETKRKELVKEVVRLLKRMHE